MPGRSRRSALVRAELEPRGVPVIGFAGAPFTLASYAIEGGSSKDFSRTKAFMLSEPAAWRRLLTKLVTVQADYLLAQARAGAQALQVFDSWAGRALGREDYLRYVAPHNRELFAAVADGGVPGGQLLARYVRVPRGRGSVRRRRRRARLAAPARRGVGAGRPRAAGAGEPRSGGAARPLAGAPAAHRRRPRSRRRPARARLQRRARARPADAGRQRAAPRRARAGADHEPVSDTHDRAARDGVRHRFSSS